MRALLCTVATILLVSFTGFAKPKEKGAPSWVTEVASRSVPAYPGQVPAAVLLYEQHVTVSPSGLLTILTRRAVKILNHEGKREAEVVEEYEKGGRQVKELHAWLVAPDGFVKTFEKNNIVDLGVYSDDLYNDYRVRRIKADNAELGSVFAYESEVNQQAMEAQDRFLFQDNLPAVESRYTITVPAGWTASGKLLNHDPIQPVVDGTSYTWVLKKLPFHEKEELAPQFYGTAPLLAIDFQPPAGITDPPMFKAWNDVSQWHTSLAAAQAGITAEMTDKVRELTTGRPSEYDKIRAIGHFVQKFRYVEIAMDLSHNGGYLPHAAPQVFEKQYGDCKDKANLMRALLKAAGIPSYLVAIYAGDRTFVKQEWASPWQFNHMILAVQVNDATKAPTVIDGPVGRLLLFDPTDDKTPMGDLPYYEQGSFALLCAGTKGDLLRMPVITPDLSLLSQSVVASISADGTITASLDSRSSGQSARRERGLYESGSPEHYKAGLERYLNYYAKGASVTDIKAHDSFDENQFATTVNFTSHGYAQLMQNRMFVFNMGVIEPNSIHLAAAKDRVEPIILNGRLYRKHVELKLPPNFSVDEMPSPFNADSSFAHFSLSYRQEAGQLIMDEQLRTEAVTLPPAEYTKVKVFFDHVFGSDSQNVVLVKN